MKNTNDQFARALNNLVTATSAIEIRLHEIQEFEKQWKALFNSLSDEFGADVKINISNQLLLYTFRYDKFHIVCDDLLSLIENESQNEFSVCRVASTNVAIKNVKEYIENEKTKSYAEFVSIDAKTSEESKIDGNLEKDFFAPIFANEIRNSHLKNYRELFGEGTTDDERWQFLKAQLVQLIQKIKGLRHLFSHKYFNSIQTRYSEKWNDLQIEKVEEWFNEFFKILQKIKLLCDGSYYRGMVTAFPVPVADQIDLIIFGTIERCVSLIHKKYPDKSYAVGRREFYRSKEFRDIVVSNKSHLEPT